MHEEQILLQYFKHGTFHSRKAAKSGTIDHVLPIFNEMSLTPCRPDGLLIKKKVNVYLPYLMMKVPDHLYVLGDTIHVTRK
jgi:hypothetical protein